MRRRDHIIPYIFKESDFQNTLLPSSIPTRSVVNLSELTYYALCVFFFYIFPLTMQNFNSSVMAQTHAKRLLIGCQETDHTFACYLKFAALKIQNDLSPPVGSVRALNDIKPAKIQRLFNK